MEKKQSSSKAWSLAFPQSPVTDLDTFEAGKCSAHLASKVEDSNENHLKSFLSASNELDRSLPEIHVDIGKVLVPANVSFRENNEKFGALVSAESKSMDSAVYLESVENHDASAPSDDHEGDASNGSAFVTSTPKSHPISSSALKYKVASDEEWNTSGDVSERVSPDGENSPMGKYFYGLPSSDSDEISDPRAALCLKADAEAIAAKLLSEKTFSSSSSDPMDKLSIIDVDGLGFDSLLMIPSSDDDTSKSPCTQRPAVPDVCFEKNSSDGSPCQSEGNDASSNGGNNFASCGGNNSTLNDDNNFTVNGGNNSIPYEGNNSISNGGNNSTSNGGNNSTSNGGNNSTSNGGNNSTLNGGNNSTSNGGNNSTSNGGNNSTSNGGNNSTSNGGNNSTSNGGNNSTLNGGNNSTLNGGNNSTSNGGNNSTLNEGNNSTSNEGNNSTLNGGNNSTLNGGNNSTLNGGNNSISYEGNNTASHGGNNSSVSSASSLSKSSRIPRLVANYSAVGSPILSTKTPAVSGLDRRSRCKLTKSQSLSCSHLSDSHTISQPSSSSGTPAPGAKGRAHQSSRSVTCRKKSVIGSHVQNEKAKRGISSKVAPLVRSVSLSSLSNPKKVGYRHVESKVKKYIEEIKRSNSRLSPPSRSFTSSPCRTPTPIKSNTVYLVNDDLIDALDSPLPDELQLMVDKLQSASGSPVLLRNLLRQLVRERESVSALKETVATLQLNYDNLLAKHSQSQNLIDHLRLQASTSENNLSLVDSGCASSALWGRRRHSVSFAGLSPSRTDREMSLSSSQPNLVDYTSSPLVEPNLGLSFDETGSVCLLPNPFESNANVPLLPSDSANESDVAQVAFPISFDDNKSRASDANLDDSNVSAFTDLHDSALATHHHSRTVLGSKIPRPASPSTVRAVPNPCVKANVPPSCQNLRLQLRDLAPLLASQALTKSETDAVWASLMRSLSELSARGSRSSGLHKSSGPADEIAELWAAARFIASEFCLPFPPSVMLPPTPTASNGQMNDRPKLAKYPRAKQLVETGSKQITRTAIANKMSCSSRVPSDDSSSFGIEFNSVSRHGCSVAGAVNNSLHVFLNSDVIRCSEATVVQAELLAADSRSENCSSSLNPHADRHRNRDAEQGGVGSPFSSNISLHLIPSGSSPEPPTLADVESLPVMSEGPEPCNLSNQELRKYIAELKTTDVSTVKASIGPEVADSSCALSTEGKDEVPVLVSREVLELFSNENSSSPQAFIGERIEAFVGKGKKGKEDSKRNDFSVLLESRPAEQLCKPLSKVDSNDALNLGSSDFKQTFDVNTFSLPQGNTNYFEFPLSSGQEVADSADVICSEDQVEVCISNGMISAYPKSMKDQREQKVAVLDETSQSENLSHINGISEAWIVGSTADPSGSLYEKGIIDGANDNSFTNDVKESVNKLTSPEHQIGFDNSAGGDLCNAREDETPETAHNPTQLGISNLQGGSGEFQPSSDHASGAGVVRSPLPSERRALQDDEELELQNLGQDWNLGETISGTEMNDARFSSPIRGIEMNDARFLSPPGTRKRGAKAEDRFIRCAVGDVDSGCPVSDRSLRLSDNALPLCDSPLRSRTRCMAAAASDGESRVPMQKEDCRTNLRKCSALSRSYEVFPSWDVKSRVEPSLYSAHDTSESDCSSDVGRKEKRNVKLLFKNLQKGSDSLKINIGSRKPKSGNYETPERRYRGRAPLKVVHDNFISSGTEADTEVSSSPVKRKKKLMHSHVQRTDSSRLHQFTPRLSRKFSSCVQLTELHNPGTAVQYSAKKYGRSHSLPRTTRLPHCDGIPGWSARLGGCDLDGGRVREKSKSRCRHCRSVEASPGSHLKLGSCHACQTHTKPFCDLKNSPCRSEPCSPSHQHRRRPRGESKPRYNKYCECRACTGADVIVCSHYGRRQNLTGGTPSCPVSCRACPPCPFCLAALERAHDSLVATTAAANSVHARSRALLRYLRSTARPM